MDAEALESALGHRFRDRALLELALTHTSRAYEQGHGQSRSNEQLEFLGDAILGFVASEWLLKQFPQDGEGQLSKSKAHLVSAAHLYQAAQAIGLGQHLRLGKGEEMSGGREKKTLLADAMEALIAALYLDGGIEPARRFIESHVLNLGVAGPELHDSFTNFKGTLSELARSLNLPQPAYRVLEERGPGHEKIFVVEASIGPHATGRGEGRSKKSAEQEAARIVLGLIQRKAG